VNLFIQNLYAMKVQMVIVANAKEERGRSLIGIRLENGSPMMRSGKPQWLRPVMQRSKTSIPTPLVVDLRPLDVIELQLTPDACLDDPDGYVEVDFYQLQIKGRMALEDLLSCCSIPATAGIFVDDAAAAPVEEVLGRATCMILVCQCSVISLSQGLERQQAVLQFGFCGLSFQFPLADPLFLDHFAITPESLACKRSVQIVLSPIRRRKGKDLDFRVLSVLL
jgi:hypothetical protein